MAATSIDMTVLTGYLADLVAFDTRNGVGDELPCAQYLAQCLKTYHPDSLKIGTALRSRARSDGAYVLAQWGRPRVIINVHLDTVPSGQGWDTDPLTLTRKGERLYGLGAADIKGAIACVLSCMALAPPKNVAVLFSGDEEQGSELMAQIVSRGDYSDAPLAIICEPTGALPGLRHRGFAAFAQDFTGPGGHSSAADQTPAPALDAARVASALGDFGAAHLNVGPEGFKGLCMNVGSLQGDGAHNVIPTQAQLLMSLRPPPGDDVNVRAEQILNIMNTAGPRGAITQLARHTAFACDDISAFKSILGPLADKGIDLPYWTEAAMLAQTGKNCIVFGPGHINVAHAPNEFVTLGQLAATIDVYSRALSGEYL
ncbi:M20/M25/M40 family metallo-hydrolase [Robiginitomaculum antarcticum]|uniref:M20/M25/M40 family metallo-hydrolase n=1 Tax=Robiginitomaculum antarcticum TaxID=437507 RepID=UPI00035EAF34|nr:M20/M25/M40 family metallo-hydrolase [Robiginitomaculum antarcticum]